MAFRFETNLYGLPKKLKEFVADLLASAGLAKQLSALNHHTFNFGDSFSRVQTLRTNIGTIHNGVAAVELERVFKSIQTIFFGVIAAIY